MHISQLINYSADCTSVPAVMPSLERLEEVVTVAYDDSSPILISHLSNPVLVWQQADLPISHWLQSITPSEGWMTTIVPSLLHLWEHHYSWKVISRQPRTVYFLPHAPKEATCKLLSKKSKSQDCPVHGTVRICRQSCVICIGTVQHPVRAVES